VEAWQPLQQPLISCAGVIKVLCSICGNELRPHTAQHSTAQQGKVLQHIQLMGCSCWCCPYACTHTYPYNKEGKQKKGL